MPINQPNDQEKINCPLKYYKGYQDNHLYLLPVDLKDSNYSDMNILQFSENAPLRFPGP